MTRDPRIRRSAGAEGFVLVGVLMFILILTILGLTLFSLSSFESQFFTNSLDQQRAFYSATAGVERAKFVLANTSKFANVRDVSGVPIDGLVYTVAWRGDYAAGDSNGTVDWRPGRDSVWIRSIAVVAGQRAMVEAQYKPVRDHDDYRRMFTLADPSVGLTVKPLTQDPNNPSLTYNADQQVQLYGELSQTATNTGTFMNAAVPPAPVTTGAALDVPDVAGFLAAHMSPPGGLNIVQPQATDQYLLDASLAADRIAFFYTPASLGDDTVNGWSLNADASNGAHAASPNASITVRGTCIWMFDEGVRFNKVLQINGSGASDDALVLVALPSQDYREYTPSRGIVLGGGVTATTVPVVLVANRVGIEQYPNIAGTSSIAYLSVFASNCQILGPMPGTSLTLNHVAGAPPDQPGGLIDRLSKKGYLPNTHAGRDGSFALKPGSWQEITD